MAPKPRTSKRSRSAAMTAAEAEAGPSEAAPTLVDYTIPHPRYPSVIFISTEQRSRFVTLLSRPVVPTRFLHGSSLSILGIEKTTRELFESIGMGYLFRMNELTYAHLVYEFLSSLEYEGKKTRRVTFRLNNRDHRMSLSEFGAKFGLATNGETSAPSSFVLCPFWAILTHIQETTARTSHFSSKYVHHPCIRIWLRFMALTCFGRNEPHEARSDELSILWGVLRSGTKYKFNIPHMMLKHFIRTRNITAHSSNIPFGGLITHLAVKCAAFVDVQSPYAAISGSFQFDLNYMTSNLEWIQMIEGKYTWFIGKDKKTWLKSITFPSPLTALQAGKEHYLLPTSEIGAPLTVPPPTYHRRDRVSEASTSASPMPPVMPTPTPTPTIPTPAFDMTAMYDTLAGMAVRNAQFQNYSTMHMVGQQLYMYPRYHEDIQSGVRSLDGPHPAWYTGGGSDGGYPGNVFVNAGIDPNQWGPGYAYTGYGGVPDGAPIHGVPGFTVGQGGFGDGVDLFGTSGSGTRDDDDEMDADERVSRESDFDIHDES